MYVCSVESMSSYLTTPGVTPVSEDNEHVLFVCDMNYNYGTIHYIYPSFISIESSMSAPKTVTRRYHIRRTGIKIVYLVYYQSYQFFEVLHHRPDGGNRQILISFESSQNYI